MQYKPWFREVLGTGIFRWHDEFDEDTKTEISGEVAAIIQRGGLVAFPTETVYGLGADVFNSAAVERIFKVKGRPLDNPFIIHLWNISQLTSLARELPSHVQILAEKFWPGPLTLVLSRRQEINPAVSAGLPTVAVRIPNHPAAFAMLEAADTPVAAPSANLSGKPSPTESSHVEEELAGEIDAILDGGRCTVGVESTVLDLTRESPVILRPGGVTREELEDCLQEKVIFPENRQSGQPSSPGMKYRHYAPQARMLLFKGDPAHIKENMHEHYLRFHNAGNRVGILCTRENASLFPEAVVKTLGSQSDLREAATSLYRNLRELDKNNVDIILAESFPEKGIGAALTNRLEKAADEIV